jgi:cytochrome b6-f complex iron-sulfur subunit
VPPQGFFHLARGTSLFAMDEVIFKNQRIAVPLRVSRGPAGSFSGEGIGGVFCARRIGPGQFSRRLGMAAPESTNPKPDAAKTPVAGGGEAAKFVGTPAVGTSKAAPAAGIPTVGPAASRINNSRRNLVWCAVAGFLGAWFIAFIRFFLPRTLFEPPTVFKIGYPSDYALGVDTKWQQKYRIWVDRTPDRIFVIYARCTHLGCTPDWKASENKFKCPCHGSGYDSEGINFEGPAPRPMDRARLELAPDGQIVVDVSQLFEWPKGQPTHFSDPGSFLNV